MLLRLRVRRYCGLNASRISPLLLLCASILLVRQFITRSANNAQKLCAPMPLFRLYQLHSPLHAPVSRTPLNWLHLPPFSVPRQPVQCPSPSASPLASSLFIVHSRREHVHRREALRSQFRRNGLQVFFVVAGGADENRHAEENDLLIVRGLQERYRNLTHKARAWIRWISMQRCRFAFIVKLDDDVHVNLPALERLLKRAAESRHRHLVLCRVIPNAQVSRNPASKWFLSRREFADGTHGLGLFCQGMGIAFSGDLVPKMRANLGRVQFLWMDDWYLTHALLHDANATYVDISPQVRNVEQQDPGEKSGWTAERGGGIARAVHYTPIFAHFRPHSQFSLHKQSTEWTRMLREQDERRGANCSL